MVLEDEDQVTKSNTIYDVSLGEIMWRNFLAGMSRAVGGLVIYFGVMIVLTNLFLTYVWPTLEPSFQSFSEATDLLNQVNMLQQPGFTR